MYESLGNLLRDVSDYAADLVDLSVSTDTVFCRSLVTEGYLTQEQLCHAAGRYRLGRTTDGAVVFWEIDEQQCIRDGKLMYYLDNCHRDKNRHASWVSACLKNKGSIPDVLDPKRCLFGLHLLGDLQQGDSVAIVESEKTAIICSELYTHSIWLASGGLTMLNASKLYPLRDCRIVLFPDTDETGKTYQQWKEVADTAQEFCKYPIRVSPILELHATPDQKQRKIDLVDYLYENP